MEARGLETNPPFLQRIMEQEHGTSGFHLTETMERP